MQIIQVMQIMKGCFAPTLTISTSNIINTDRSTCFWLIGKKAI